jgi:uncharacterized protein YuzE
MKITWDKEVDAAYIYLKKGKVSYTKKKSDWLLTDHDKNGNILGIEILETSRHFFKKKKSPRRTLVKK